MWVAPFLARPDTPLSIQVESAWPRGRVRGVVSEGSEGSLEHELVDVENLTETDNLTGQVRWRKSTNAARFALERAS